MSRLTGCAFCRGSGNITPSRVRQGVTSISLSYRVNAGSAPVAKAGSTISWLNRLINRFRGGSWLICITLAVSQPVQPHRINPLRLFLRGMYLFVVWRKDAARHPGNDLCFLLYYPGPTNDFSKSWQIFSFAVNISLTIFPSTSRL